MTKVCMSQNEKYLIIGLAAIIVIACVFYFWPYLKRTYAYMKAVNTLSEQEAILILDFDGQKAEEQRWFKGEVVEGMTLMHVLQAASVAGNFSVNANSHIAAIDGVASAGNNQWICYQNDQPISGKLSDVKINPKDKVVCRYK